MNNDTTIINPHSDFRAAFHPNIHLPEQLLSEQPFNVEPTDTLASNPNHLTKIVTSRVTEAQFIVLSNNANALNMPLSHYTRSLIVDEKAQRKLVRIAGTKQQRVDAAKILSALSQTRIANNLNSLAKGMCTGTLVFTPDVVAQINEAYSMIMDIRRELFRQQGMSV